MRPEKLQQLERSLKNLEDAIKGVHKRFTERNDVPEHIITRINQYSDICARQHILCAELKFELEEQDIEQVAQQIKVINGLSAMLVEDVKQLLSGMQNQQTFDEQVIN
jgi:hypothetical protein